VLANLLITQGSKLLNHELSKFIIDDQYPFAAAVNEA
jgi:hypothetical protein